MDTATPTHPKPALTPGKAWLVGGSLAAVALGSLATALALRGPGAAPAAGAAGPEPRETIVSTLSPPPRATDGGADRPAPAAATAQARIACADGSTRTLSQPTKQAVAGPGRPRSLAELKRL